MLQDIYRKKVRPASRKLPAVRFSNKARKLLYTVLRTDVRRTAHAT